MKLLTDMKVELTDRFKTEPEVFLVTGVLTYEAMYSDVKPEIIDVTIYHLDPLSEGALNMQRAIREKYGVEAKIEEGKNIAVSMQGSLDYDLKIGKTVDTEITEVKSERTGESVSK
jgi:hypothetical protein